MTNDLVVENFFAKQNQRQFCDLILNQLVKPTKQSKADYVNITFLYTYNLSTPRNDSTSAIGDINYIEAVLEINKKYQLESLILSNLLLHYGLIILEKEKKLVRQKYHERQKTSNPAS